MLSLSFLDFLQSAEMALPIHAGSTVTRLVHGRAVELQTMGCCVEHLCCCRVIEILIFSSGFLALSAEKSFLTRNSDGRMYVTGKMKMNSVICGCLRRVSSDVMPFQTGAGIACRARARVSCRHLFKQR